MRRRLSLGFPVLPILAALALNSCSGLPGGVGTTPPGNGTLILVLKVKPPAPSSGLSLLSFAGTVTGVSLTPSTGTTSTLAAATFNVEFTRLTSDTFFLATVSAPAGAHTAVNVTFGAHTATFCTQPTPGVAGCSGAATQVSGAAGSASVTTPINITANQHSGLALVVDLGKAITLSGQTITQVSLGATGVFTAAAVPGTSDLTAAQLAHTDDILGIVTSFSSSTHSVTVETATHGSITAVQAANATYDPACLNINNKTADFGCVAANQVISLDATLNADGTFTYTYYDPVDPSPDDLIEGVVTVQGDSTTQKFTMVTTDFTFAPTASVLSGSLHLGDTVVVTLSNPSPFLIDNKSLFVPVNLFAHSTDASVVIPGQTVLLHFTSFTAANGTNPATATGVGLALRFTRINCTVATTGSPAFNVSNVAPFFGIAANSQVQFTSGFTSFDGYTDASGITVDDSISARALFLGRVVAPSFSAATIRKH